MGQYNSEASDLAFKVRWLYHHFVEDPDAIDASLFADDFTWIPAENSPRRKVRKRNRTDGLPRKSLLESS